MSIDSQEQRVANAAAEVLRRPGIDTGPRDRASASYPWGLFVRVPQSDPIKPPDRWIEGGWYRTRKAAHKDGKAGWCKFVVGKAEGL